MRAILIATTFVLAVGGKVLFAGVAAEPSESEEEAFLSQMGESMLHMHSAMKIEATGNVDADFVAMMVPHHQGAIDMARIELLYGHNEQLRRMAQEIIVAQLQEIVAMRRSLNPTHTPPETK